ncbi:hypothetical protein LAD77_29950 [Klebsiella pneumoniae]|nr:hypothetical protein [Klebsiella pneumoniae]
MYAALLLATMIGASGKLFRLLALTPRSDNPSSSLALADSCPFVWRRLPVPFRWRRWPRLVVALLISAAWLTGWFKTTRRK